MTDAIRRETEHIEFPIAAWMAFDRYTRYAALVRATRATLGNGSSSVLDVGDSAGYVAAFDPEFRLVCLDRALTPDPLPGTTRAVGDGTRLPFPDAAFDAVVSGDTLEHIDAGQRSDFLAEMVRVTRDVVVLAAPFDTPGVAGAEEAVRRFVLLAAGERQEQLEEHRDLGLPGLAATCETLASLDMEVESVGAGNLYDWLSMMLIKHQLSSRPALTPLEAGYDILYNFMFAGRERVGPFYRHLVVARKGGKPVLGESPPPVEGMPADISGVLAAIGAASVAEAARQDTEPRLDDIRRQNHEMIGLLAESRELRALVETGFLDIGGSIGGVTGAVESAAARAAAGDEALRQTLEETRSAVTQLNARLDGLAEQLTATQRTVDRLVGLVRHPVRSLSRRVGRIAGRS